MIKNKKENFSHSGIVSYQKFSILKDKKNIIENNDKKMTKDKSDKIYFENMKKRIRNLNYNNINQNNEKLKFKKYLSVNLKNQNHNYKFKNYLPRDDIFVNENGTPGVGYYNPKYKQILENTKNILIKKKQNFRKIKKKEIIYPAYYDNKISTFKENNYVNLDKIFGRSKLEHDLQNYLLNNKLSNNSKLHESKINVMSTLDEQNIFFNNKKCPNFNNYLGRQEKIKNKINYNYEPNYNLIEKKLSKNINLKFDSKNRFPEIKSELKSNLNIKKHEKLNKINFDKMLGRN